MVWGVLGKAFQGNARFRLTERIEVHFYHVRMPTGSGREKMKARSLDVLSAIYRSIIGVNAAF